MVDELLIVPPQSCVLDADSTLVGIEGIDWLADLRDDDVAGRIALLTEQAMAGSIPLDEVYGERLALVAPRREEVEELGEAYIYSLADGAQEFINELAMEGVRPVIVSGGLRPALLQLGRHLGIPAGDVYGVEVQFGADGGYRGYDRASPLASQRGKGSLVAGLGLARPIVAVGDGSTDLAIKQAGAADVFVAFTGFARRDPVVEGADWSCGSFDELREFLFPDR